MSSAIVVGAGGGGLAAALELASSGFEVTLLEGHIYPGGCAGTFSHQNYLFDVGATLAGGFREGGPMNLIGKRYGIEWEGLEENVGMEIHLPGQHPIRRWTNPEAWKEERLKHFGPDGEPFWKWQEQTADLLWKLVLEHPPWPPQNFQDFSNLLQIIGRQIGFIFKNHGARQVQQILTDSVISLRSRMKNVPELMRKFLDAQLLIAAQTTSRHVNSLYSAAALDLTRQGVVQVRGGMGGIAQKMAEALEQVNARILYRREVTELVWGKGRVRGVLTRRGERFDSEITVLNLTNANVSRLLVNMPYARSIKDSPPKDGLGAFMIYAGVEDSALVEFDTRHHQIVQKEPLGNGNSVFLSISPSWDPTRAPKNHRALTLSTHVPLRKWWRLYKEDSTEYEKQKQLMTDRTLDTASSVIPNLRDAARVILPGTPSSFEHFTKRQMGWVGGFPQTHLFRNQGPSIAPSLWMVGDSIFPGQSFPAVSLGGVRVGMQIKQKLGI